MVIVDARSFLYTHFIYTSTRCFKSHTIYVFILVFNFLSPNQEIIVEIGLSKFLNCKDTKSINKSNRRTHMDLHVFKDW